MYRADNGGVYIVFNGLKSLAEVDTGLGDSKRFDAESDEDGIKKLADLTAACVEDVQTNLFSFNPKLSYSSEEWVKADPGFWKTKAPAGAKAPAAKPAELAGPADD